MKLDTFTTDELREINDALSDAVKRMLVEQTPQEREYGSLAVAWSAQKKVVAKLLPGAAPEWLVRREADVKAQAEKGCHGTDD